MGDSSPRTQNSPINGDLPPNVDADTLPPPDATESEPPLKRTRLSEDTESDRKDLIHPTAAHGGILIPPKPDPESNAQTERSILEKDSIFTSNGLEAESEVNGGTKDRMESNDTANASDIPPNAQKVKKRKVALILAYCGAGYQGMQKNPGAKTIEGELQNALLKSKAMSETDTELRHVEWNRAARTDKGVSAVGQVVSARLYIDPPPFIERVNSFLPQSIRLLQVVRTTNGFNAKNLCERRRYEYLVPVFAFDPLKHRDRGSLEAMAMATAEASTNSKELISSNNKENESINSNDKLQEKESINSNLNSENKMDPLCINGTPNFTFDQTMLERLRKLLSTFCGTHNFHNFTARTNANDPSANRYILTFTADGPLQIDGLDFVRCEVVGQSFMLHQIRKMVGSVLAIMRGHAPPTFLDYALRKDKKVNVPLAPELGLFLDECLFNSYNRKFASSHEELSLSTVKNQVQEFKVGVIYKHIASTEKKEHTMANWLPNLNDKNYPEFLDLKNEGEGRERHGEGMGTEGG